MEEELNLKTQIGKGFHPFGRIRFLEFSSLNYCHKTDVGIQCPVDFTGDYFRIRPHKSESIKLDQL
ncbi:MAG: hypothetical protein ABGY96_20920 [bacterium]